MIVIMSIAGVNSMCDTGKYRKENVRIKQYIMSPLFTKYIP